MSDLEKIASQGAELFIQIRDIPYGYGEGEMTCYPKHERLKDGLEELGYKITIWFVKFDWKSLPFPEEIKEQLIGDMIENHTYLEFELGDYNGIIDISFDIKLKEAGFQVNEWDGKSSTKQVVEYIGEPKTYHPLELLARTIYSTIRDIFKTTSTEKDGKITEKERFSTNIKIIQDYLTSVRKA